MDQHEARLQRAIMNLPRKHEQDDEINLALASFGSVDAEAGQALLQRLAPDDGVDYDKAHRLKAMQLVAALTDLNRDGRTAEEPSRLSQEDWERVRLHLTRSGLDRLPWINLPNSGVSWRLSRLCQRG